MSIKTKAIIAVLITNTTWGFSFIFTKMALEFANPIILLMYRFLTAFICINIVGLISGQKLNFKGKKLGKLLVFGLLYPVIYFACENFGIGYSSATFSGLMISLIPIVAMLLGSVFLREHPTGKQYLFSVLALVGVVMVSISPVAGELTTALGAILMVGAVFAGASQSILSRDLADKFSTYERTYIMFLEGCIAYAIIGMIMCRFDFRELTAPLHNRGFVIGILYLGILASIVASLCMNFAMGHLTIAEATAFTNLTTILSVISGVVILHEAFSIMIVPASILIILGVWGVQYYNRNQGERIRVKKSRSRKN